jgi:phage-related minor tail protein
MIIVRLGAKQMVHALYAMIVMGMHGKMVMLSMENVHTTTDRNSKQIIPQLNHQIIQFFKKDMMLIANASQIKNSV